MRRLAPLALLILAAGATGLLAQQSSAPPSQQAQAAPPPAAQSSAPAPPSAAGGAQQTAPPPVTPPAAIHLGPVVILDAAHGGTDTGARGADGAVEKDLVLQFAQSTRLELTREGYHVILTRSDDSNPSYDDRAAIANAYRDALFVSFHVSSTGTPGTARAYYYQLGNPPAPATSTASDSASKKLGPPLAASSLVPWNEAQQSHIDASHRFADQIQLEFARRLVGSPAASTSAAVRDLRSIAEPAVAVEVSSVSVDDPATLTALAPALAAAIAHGVQAMRPAGAAGGK
ncbi:MAG: N-acetylmuramoyl-L-alanine amidase [Candidatus Acidiferrales bacterium]